MQGSPNMKDDVPLNDGDALRRRRLEATQPGQIGMARLDIQAICGLCRNFSLTRKGRIGNVGKCRLAVSRYGEDVPRIDRIARPCSLFAPREELPLLTPGRDGAAADRAQRDRYVEMLGLLSGTGPGTARNTISASPSAEAVSLSAGL